MLVRVVVSQWEDGIAVAVLHKYVRMFLILVIVVLQSRVRRVHHAVVIVATTSQKVVSARKEL